MSRSFSATATVDSKGRLLIPESVRSELHIKPGDVFFFERESESGGLLIAKAINPFDILADQAREEYERGETVSLKDAFRLADQDRD